MHKILYVFLLMSSSIFAHVNDPHVAKLNNELVLVDDPLKYNDFFNRVRATSSDFPQNKTLKIYAGFADLLQSIEAITWKEEGFYKKSDFLYGLFVSFLRSTYAPDYVVGTHVRKYGRYFTEPVLNQTMYKSVSELQQDLLGKVLPAIEKLRAALAEAIEDQKFFFVLDRHILVGYVPSDKSTNKMEWFFTPETERFKTVQRSHLALLKSQIELLAGVISYLCAYQLDDFIQYADDLMKIVTWRGLKKILLFRNNIDPLTTKDKVELLQREKFKNFLVLKEPQLLAQALNYWIESTRSRLKGLSLRGQTSKIPDLIEPLELELLKKQELALLNERVDILEKAQKDEVMDLTVPATRYSFKFNPSRLFAIADYKKLLAKTFYGESQRRPWFKVPWHADSGPAVHEKYGEFSVWDFNFGKPVTYLDPTFNGMIPDGTDENYLEYIKSLRLLPAVAPLMNLLPLH